MGFQNKRGQPAQEPICRCGDVKPRRRHQCNGNTAAFLLNFYSSKNTMDLSSQYKGTITELNVASHLLSLGYNVSQPLTQDSKYDLIVDVNHKLIRIQVKTARINEKTQGLSIKFNCRSTTNNVRECKQRYYSTEDVDYFATWWNNEVFIIPVNECSAEKTIWIDKPHNPKSTYAYDYLAEEVLKTI